MRERIARSAVIAASVAALMLWVPPVASGHGNQHGPSSDHLLGTGASGDLQFLAKLDLTDEAGIIADVGVDPRSTYAYLAHWGKPTCAANSEAGGTTDPDAGVFVADITDLEHPSLAGFIPHSQDSRPGEGVQALEVGTAAYNGVLLVTNNEQCGKNGKGGVSLYDVTNPRKPFKLSEHFGDRGSPRDVNDIHSAFAWDAGARAYVVMTDNAEATDVDILDITNPRRPRQVLDLNINEMTKDLGNPVFQPELGLDQSFLHDMVVKNINGHWIMLLSYWDGGYVQLNVDDPAHPVFLGDTDYAAVDPELADPSNTQVPAASRTLPPEGNGHQNEFTRDNRMFIGTDEDFSPYRSIFNITTGPNAGQYPAGEFGWTVPVVQQADKRLNGPTVFGGYGCPDDRATIPPRSSVFPAGTLAPDEQAIVVLSRGPVDDPGHPHDACFFSEKVESAQLAGYDGVIIPNHHVGAQAGDAPDASFCGGQGHVFTPTIPAVCTGHRAMHLLFNSTPAYDVPYVAGTEPTIGTLGEEVDFAAVFDGWGYVHLFDRTTFAELDTFAIDEGHDPAFAFGFGDLTVHEVATDPNDAGRAYLSYYAGGIRSLRIVCSNPSDTTTCELVESGRYLSPQGNNFWGVEAFSRNGTTYVAGSDRDDGLYLFATRQP